MPIDYDQFRATTWDERLRIFAALSPEGRSELFRSQVSGWLDRHSAELTAEQIALLHEAMEVAVPELYAFSKPPKVVARFKEFEQRARALLTPEQCLNALTMQWGMT